MRLNTEALKDDLRKLGLVLIGGGMIAIFLNTPPVDFYTAIYAIAVGMVLYIAGLSKGEGS